MFRNFKGRLLPQAAAIATFWIVLSLLAVDVTAQTSVLPPNGILGFNAYPSPDASAIFSTIGVAGQSFNQARSIQTKRSFANPWDAGLVVNAAASVAKDDVIAGEIWLRRVSAVTPDGAGYAQLNFERNSGDYLKSLAVSIVEDVGVWTRLRFAFRSLDNFPVGSAQVSVFLGYGPQAIQLGGLRMTNYGASVSLGSFTNEMTYSGRSLLAPWRAAAASRIEQLRRSDLTVEVRDLMGRKVPGAVVDVRMKRHAFGFGSAVNGSLLFKSGVPYDHYRQVVTQWFNKVVIENDLKWPSWEGNRNLGVNSVNWLRQRGIAVRGHNLIWPGVEFLPADVPPLFAAPDSLRTRINSHFTNELGLLAGKCVEWDVINEPPVQRDVMNVLGDAEMNAWMRTARALDPKAKLFINDYDNIEALIPNNPHANTFFGICSNMVRTGVPLDGIGLQGHYLGALPSLTQVLSTMDRFATLGPDLEITEFDVDVADPAAQAEYTRDLLTAGFSHPKSIGILLWGFWESSHWRPNAALFNAAWNMRPNGVAYSNLVFSTWWTQTNGIADGAGALSLRGFKGDYEIRLHPAIGSFATNISLLSPTTIQLVIDTGEIELIAEKQGGEILMSWPQSALPWVLEAAVNSASPQWGKVFKAPVKVGSRWQVAVPTSGIAQMFRLRR